MYTVQYIRKKLLGPLDFELMIINYCCFFLILEWIIPFYTCPGMMLWPSVNGWIRGYPQRQSGSLLVEMVWKEGKKIGSKQYT